MTPNSVGQRAKLKYSRAASVGSGNLTLEVIRLPPATFGMFVCSDAICLQLASPAHQGRLCLASNIGRFDGPSQLAQSTAAGTATLAIDLARLPRPNGTCAVAPGDSFAFQLWYRDSHPGPTSNFSSAITLNFH